MPVRLEGVADGAAAGGRAATAPIRSRSGKILGLALGVVPAADGRSTVLTDLVVAWAEGEKGATVLRASLGDLGLDRLYPGVPPKEAYWRLVGEIEKASGAKRLPPGRRGCTAPTVRRPGGDDPGLPRRGLNRPAQAASAQRSTGPSSSRRTRHASSSTSRLPTTSESVR